MDIRNHIRRMTGKPEMEQMVHMEATAPPTSPHNNAPANGRQKKNPL